MDRGAWWVIVHRTTVHRVAQIEGLKYARIQIIAWSISKGKFLLAYLFKAVKLEFAGHLDRWPA